MHTGTSYRLGEFMLWTRRSVYILLLVNAVPVLLYQVGGLRWLVVPWDVVLLLGSTVALLVGLRSLKAYDRMREAESVWSSIVCGSRAWALLCRDLLADRDAVRQLLYRHLAWLTALRYEMRAAKEWEVQDKPHNVEYMRKHGVPERERPLYEELARYVSGPEAAEIVSAGSRAMNRPGFSGHLRAVHYGKHGGGYGQRAILGRVQGRSGQAGHRSGTSSA